MEIKEIKVLSLDSRLGGVRINFSYFKLLEYLHVSIKWSTVNNYINSINNPEEMF